MMLEELHTHDSDGEEVNDREEVNDKDVNLAWICVDTDAYVAATAILERDRIVPRSLEGITYQVRRVGQQKIVIAVQSGRGRRIAPSSIAISLRQRFPKIGVCFGIGTSSDGPVKEKHESVLVSTPGMEVLDWREAEVQCIGRRERLPEDFSTVLSELELEDGKPINIRQHLVEIKQKWPELDPEFTSSNAITDPLTTSETSILSAIRHKITSWFKPQTVDIPVYYRRTSVMQYLDGAKFQDPMTRGFGRQMSSKEVSAALEGISWVMIWGIYDESNKQSHKEFGDVIAAAYAKELLTKVDKNWVSECQ